MVTPGRLVFAGLPLLRGAPLTVLVWSACLLPFGVLSALFNEIYDAVRAEKIHVGSSALRGWLEFGSLSVSMLLICAGMAVIAAAVFRAVADPERVDGRWMRLGGDEIRLTLVWSFMFIAVFAAVLLIAITVAAAASAAGADASRWGTSSPTLIAACVIATVALARFALFPAVAVFEHRLALAYAWRMTRGRFGAAVVCALVFLILYGGSEWLLMTVEDLLQRGASAEGIGAGPVAFELIGYVTRPEKLASNLARAMVQAFAGVVIYAPMATLYLDLAGRNPADQAAVFD